MTSSRFIPGVDEPLPEGETLLWAGAPSVRAQLRHSAVTWIMIAWFVGAAVLLLTSMGPESGPTAAHLTWVAVIGAASLGLVAGFAWLVHRTTSYAITDRRVVMRIGIALPAVFNVPLEALSGADVRVCADGTGDIDLPLADDRQVGFALLWPHARPWRLRAPQPAMRWLPDVEAPAAILRSAALASGRFDS